MRRMECEDCGHNKSSHNHMSDGKSYCYECWEILRDNRSEYIVAKMYLWHKFRMNNLKWLEEQFEKTL